jgi:hypothetical protein
MKENPLTMEMLLDQLIGLDIIQYAAIPMILPCHIGVDSHNCSKKDYNSFTQYRTL